MTPKFSHPEDNRIFLARTDREAVEFARSSTDKPNDHILEEIVDHEPIRRIPMGIKPMSKSELQRAADRLAINKGE